MATLTCLIGDQESDIYRHWLPWLRRIDSIYMQCLEKFDYRPFHDHEQAAVSLMVGAAHRAGLLAFAECEVAKGEGSGRGDLWIACENKHYWFEFKRSAFDPNAPKWGLGHALEVAIRDIGKLHFATGEIGVAGVIAATDILKKGYRATYDDFKNCVDYAFRLGPNGSRGAYLYFKLMDQ